MTIGTIEVTGTTAPDILTQSANSDPIHYHEALIQYTDPAGILRSVIFDAVLSEDWNQPATITEHPVEKGANIADHVRVQLAECKLKIRVSNEPLDSNMFARPVGGDGNYSPLAITIPTPDQQEFDGVVDVPLWKSNQTLAIEVGNLGAVLGEAVAKGVEDVLAGNKVAAALKPLTVATQTGNEVIAYPTPDLPLSGKPVQSIGDALAAGIREGVTSLVPAGEEITVPVATDAGLPSHEPIQPIVAQTIQFSEGQWDFAALMTDLLKRLKDAATIFTLYGSKQTMPFMVIAGFSTHRGPPEDTGTGVEITLELKQVRVVTTNTVAAPLANLPRAKTPVNAGAQDPTPTTPAVQQSVWHKVMSGAIQVNPSGKLPGSLP